MTPLTKPTKATRAPRTRARKIARKRPLKTRSTKERTKLILACDRECARLVKAIAQNRCERCGSFRPLDWAHSVKRKHLSLRWSHQNTRALCRVCHEATENESQPYVAPRTVPTYVLPLILLELKRGRFLQGERI